MSNATAENAPETLEKVIAKVKDSAEIDLKNGEFYGATTLLKYAKSVKGKEGEKAQLQDWLDREPTRVAMGILFGSIEAIVDPKVSPTFSSLYAKLKKEYKNKDGDFANALIALQNRLRTL